MTEEEKKTFKREAAWDFSGTGLPVSKTTFTSFAQCMQYYLDEAAKESKAGEDAELQEKAKAYKDMAGKEAYKRAQKFVEWFESQYKCSGLCKVGYFYYSLSLDEGRPTTTCMSFLKEAIGNNLTYLGIVSLLAGIFTFFSFLVQYCLWRKWEDDD